MNKQDLIDAVANASGTTKADAERVLEALTTVTQHELAKGNEVTLHGLGKLKVSQRKARTGRNPQTGEAIQIPAKNVPGFSAAKALKDAVNAG
mgnify:CR=1 FL=1